LEKKNRVVESTVEVEYKAMVSLNCELVW